MSGSSSRGSCSGSPSVLFGCPAGSGSLLLFCSVVLIGGVLSIWLYFNMMSKKFS